MAPSFPQRKLGSSHVSAIGLGCMGMAIPPFDDEESLSVLTAAADLGLNFWVTSDAYGETESLIGRWFALTGRRSEIFLATKFGRRALGADGKMKISGDREYVLSSCERSLERLGTQWIDLYCQHRVDPEVPIEITVGAMKELVQAGKVREVGLSECSANTLRRACKVHQVAAVEMEFSPFALEIEDPATGFLTTARELGVSVVCYAPLGKGFLTGKFRSRDDLGEKDFRRAIPRYSEENFGSNLRLVELLEGLAKEKSCTTGQLVLAWIMSQGEDFIPLPGTKHVKYLLENAGAVKIEISKEEDEKIRKVIESVGGAKGARYPEIFMSTCFADSPELK